LPALLELQGLCLPAEEMVGKNPLHITASTCEMSQLYAPLLPADYSCCKTSRERRRNSLAKGATDRLVGKERSLGLVSESRVPATTLAECCAGRFGTRAPRERGPSAVREPREKSRRLIITFQRAGIQLNILRQRPDNLGGAEMGVQSLASSKSKRKFRLIR
jgi:hypothetical protein